MRWVVVMIVTGGHGASTSAEIIFGNGSTCALPRLPQGRVYNSQAGLTVCGGAGPGHTQKTCATLRHGAWATSHNLVQSRILHESWNSPEGIILFGGRYSKRTTEILSKTDITSKAKFSLPYDTE